MPKKTEIDHYSDKEALDFHIKGKSGKIEINSSKPLTTKRDLSAMGAFLIMGLFGLIIASVVNLFVGSGQMSFIISVLGVLIFAGLTAWDTQKLKRDWLNRVQYSGQEVAEKSAIMGALTLYLDFINLFLFILQFMGRRD